MVDEKYKEHVEAWAEAGGPAMVRASTSSRDPVEMNAHELKNFIDKLIECFRQISDGDSPGDAIPIMLNRAEALVLVDFLVKRIDASKTVDAAAEQVLNNLECSLERWLPELFGQDFKDKIEAARKHVLGQE